MAQDEINEEKAWVLLSAQLSNEASKQQVHDLQKWVDENPWFKPVMKCYTALWATRTMSSVEKLEAQLAFEKHWKKIEQLQARLEQQDHQEAGT